MGRERHIKEGKVNQNLEENGKRGLLCKVAVIKASQYLKSEKMNTKDKMAHTRSETKEQAAKVMLFC